MLLEHGSAPARGRRGRVAGGSPAASEWHERFARSGTSCSMLDIRSNPRAGGRHKPIAIPPLCDGERVELVFA
jgi:hypothetical protein